MMEGANAGHARDSIVPAGLMHYCRLVPNVETLGYSRPSLRDLSRLRKLLGCARETGTFRRLLALQVLIYVGLVGSLGSVTSLLFLGLLAATVLLWAIAIIVAARAPVLPAQAGPP
jgi:hypothetical protein